MSSRALFNDGWAFLKLAANSTLADLDKSLANGSAFTPVAIPHDWLIQQTQDLYESSTGWYQKNMQGQPGRLVLEFDGVYMDTQIFLNRKLVFSWEYGYSAFEVDLTGALRAGKNELLVRVNYQSPNSRWYTGAGIYRDVWLVCQEESYLPLHGSYLTTHPMEGGYTLLADTEVVARKPLILMQRVVNAQNDTVLSLHAISLAPSDTVQTVSHSWRLADVQEWDVESPNLYRLENSLLYGDISVDSDKTTFGFRRLEYRPEEGFWLNGRRLKLNGTCEHHDLGCLGAAFNRSAMERRLRLLQGMGVNAIRTAHNMPARSLMELADRMGMLVLSEAFDMWERPKNQFDYARFFKDCYPKDVCSWIRRDRNHPSVLMWSIGNEILDTHADQRGQELTQALIAQVRLHDPRCNAPVTIGSNYMPWENAQKCADLVKLAGYNYAEQYYDEHHSAHPDWIIYGSETASVVQSRGIYHFPLHQSVLSDEDLQCSALGNSTTSWGARSIESCILAERDRPYSCGQFLWSGFDYIGEPTPYHTKNSYFGQLDTAGFPKDAYYLYKSAWTDYHKAPMVHLFPYWDFNQGQLVDLRVCTNAPRLALFQDGALVGEFCPQHQGGDQLVAHFQLPYRPGVLEAVAYDEHGAVVATHRRASFGDAAALCLRADKTVYRADAQELAFVEISATDAQGNPVENANCRVEVTVSGPGGLVGLDNGDSTDYEAYKGTSRRLFSGKLLAVVAPTLEAGSIRVEVTSPGLQPAVLELATEYAQGVQGVCVQPGNRPQPRLYPAQGEDRPIRKLELCCAQTKLNAQQPSSRVTVRLLPEGCQPQELLWAVVDDAGIASNLAAVELAEGGAVVTARGDGCFRLRCMAKNGMPHVSLISQLNFSADGLGKAFLDPYSFVAGGLYSYTNGRATNGNEHGVATARDGETVVGFSDLDFGDYGADEITLPIFALTDDLYHMEIWEGIAGQAGSSLLAEVTYQKPKRWNVYQTETYRLPRRIRGIAAISFVLRQKVHLKGFSFTRRNPAFERLAVCDCKRVYGDRFTQTPELVADIGNNVTIELGQLDFAQTGASRVTISGRAHIPTQAVHLRFTQGDREIKQLVEFAASPQLAAQSFNIQKVAGTQDVKLVFLPGSHFDFQWICFEP